MEVILLPELLSTWAEGKVGTGAQTSAPPWCCLFAQSWLWIQTSPWKSILPDMNTHNTNKTHTQTKVPERECFRLHPPRFSLFHLFFFLFPFLLPQNHSYIVVTMETEWSALREGLRERQRQYGWECSVLDCGREIEQRVTNNTSPLPTALCSSTSRGITVSHHNLIMGILAVWKYCIEQTHVPFRAITEHQNCSYLCLKILLSSLFLSFPSSWLLVWICPDCLWILVIWLVIVSLGD